MIDMINPADAERIAIQDLVKPMKMHLSGQCTYVYLTICCIVLHHHHHHHRHHHYGHVVVGILFDVVFNLHKFLRFEGRDPFQEKQRREDPFNTDWDRFACAEYHRLAAEEEGYSGNNMDVDEADNLYMQTSVQERGGEEWCLDDDDDE